MSRTTIRDAGPADFEAIVALNDAHVEHTSPMDLGRLIELHRLSCHHKVADVDGEAAAFVLAMSEQCDYVNPNYCWFASRYPRFLYVDRIVVGAGAIGAGVGSALYRDLFHYARACGIPVVACEYNVVPPNEPSRAFHRRFGFSEVGTRWLANDSKKVSMQVSPASRTI